MMGALGKLQPRPGMVEALTRIYRDRDGKGRLPPGWIRWTCGRRPTDRCSWVDLRSSACWERARVPISTARHRVRTGSEGQCHRNGHRSVQLRRDRRGQTGSASIRRGSASHQGRTRSMPARPRRSTRAFGSSPPNMGHLCRETGRFRTAWVTYEEFYSCPDVYGTPDVVGRNLEEVAEKILAFERDLASKADQTPVKGWTYHKDQQGAAERG